MSDIKKVGFIGIGRMGYPMAGFIAKAGFDVIISDTSPEQIESFLKDHGNAKAADSLVALGEEADIVITMLPTSKIVRAVILGDGNSDCVANGMSKGKIVIDASTSDPVDTQSLGKALAEKGIEMLDAPVAGGMVFARDGTLEITAGGDKSLIEKCRPVFDAYSKSLFYCGDLGAGHAMKALNNYVNASALITAIEALSLGAKFGLDMNIMMESMTAAATGRNNPIEKKVIPHILTRKFGTGMDLTLLAKDTRITVDMANAIGAFAPVAERCSALWTEASEKIGAMEDQTCVAKLWEQNNGVTLELKK